MAKAKKPKGILSQRCKKLRSVTVADVVASLPADLIEQCAKRAEEMERSARVTQKDLQLRVTM